MPLTAFQPSGTTKLIAASSSTAGGEVTQVSTGSQPGMHIVNASTATVPVYVATGATSAVQAACPTTTVPSVGLCIPAQGYVNLSTPPGGWLSAVTSAGTAAVFATPGAYGS
jgi:hypothetical protein